MKPTTSELATRLPQRLAASIDDAHELAKRIAATALPPGTPLSHGVAEARNALAVAIADLAATTDKFHRVSELLRSIED